MKKPPRKSSPAGKRKPGRAGELEQFSSPSHHTKYVLRLYVSGSTLKSARAVENIKRVCEQHLKNRYDLEVIDVYQQANLVGDDQIVTVPTLIVRLPPPRRRVMGDLSNQQNVLLGLGLRKGED
jgi:circadian clock protein KaiB